MVTLAWKTSNPSQVVKTAEVLIPKNAKVLDLGCGGGRNSVYLALKGHNVTAIDVADLGWSEGLENVNFIKGSVLEEVFPNNIDLIIMARLIAYLSFDELEALLNKCTRSLKQGGRLAFSYVVNGGIFTQNQIKVPKYKHELQKVKELLGEIGFKIIFCKSGGTKSKYVNFDAQIESYDIVCVRTD